MDKKESLAIPCLKKFEIIRELLPSIKLYNKYQTEPVYFKK